MNIWDLTKDDVLICEDGEYRFLRDTRERRPGLGVTDVRTLVNVSTGKKSKFISGAELFKVKGGWAMGHVVNQHPDLFSPEEVAAVRAVIEHQKQRGVLEGIRWSTLSPEFIAKVHELYVEECKRAEEKEG